MQAPTGPINWSNPSTYECVDCGYRVNYVEMIEGAPRDFLVPRPGGTVERVLTIAGNEVHRCPSLFLISTL